MSQTLDFDSHFEEAVYDALEQHGFDVVPQVQSSSYSIDLAIKHPDKPGEFVLGIECDGAAYHSSKTARDRDRTRQAVLEDLGWTIHRIWSPDWASNREREIEKIKQRVASIVGGATVSTEPDQLRSYEPEVIEVDSKSDHPEVTEYQNPSLSASVRYSPDKLGMDRAVRNSLQDVIVEYGPIKQDTAYKAALDVWSQSRAGKKIQRIFKSRVSELQRDHKVYEHSDFLWPDPDRLDFKVRVNTDSASRSIDKIPTQEIAKAVALLLEEGGRMTMDDLILETTRLFGYQRRGDRIEERIEEAVTLLRRLNTIDDSEGKISIEDGSDVERQLLGEIYTSTDGGSTAIEEHEDSSLLVGKNTDTENVRVTASDVDGKCPSCGHKSFKLEHEGETLTCIKCGKNHLKSSLDPL